MSGVHQIPKDLRASRPAGPRQIFHPSMSKRFHRTDKVIAIGGTGIIYSGIDMETYRPVALKVSTVLHKETLRKEAVVYEYLPDHDNLVSPVGHGYEDNGDRYCIAFRFISGGTLSQKLESGPLPFTEVLKIFLQTVNGLSVADQIGVIHRDLKPENLMIDENGVVKILDFGTSRHADAAGKSSGTPGYMSPEQILGKKTDRRSDMYSLGIILQEMINGGRTFSLKEELPIDEGMESLYRDTQAGPPALRYFSIDEEIRSLTQALVNKLTAFDREDRFKTYDEVLTAVLAIGVRLAEFNEQTRRELALLNPGPLQPLNID